MTEHWQGFGPGRAEHANLLDNTGRRGYTYTVQHHNNVRLNYRVSGSVTYPHTQVYALIILPKVSSMTNCVTIDNHVTTDLETPTSHCEFIYCATI